MSKICSDSNCLFSPERKWPFGTSRNIGSVCKVCSRSRNNKRKSLSTPSLSPSPKRQDVLTLNTSPEQPRTPQASPFVVGLPPVSCKQDTFVDEQFVDERFVSSATPNGLAPPTKSPAATSDTDWQPLNLPAAGSPSAGSPVAASPSAGSPAACLFTGCLFSFFDTEAEVGAGSTPFGGHQ